MNFLFIIYDVLHEYLEIKKSAHALFLIMGGWEPVYYRFYIYIIIMYLISNFYSTKYKKIKNNFS